jgi:predicted nucleotidyltransferase
MIKFEEIETYAKNVAAEFKPDKIILFGSYANKSASENSDVDLLVIMHYQGKASQQALTIRRNIPKRFPLDLVVQSPDEATRRLSEGDPFIVEAFKQGRVLYAEH